MINDVLFLLPDTSTGRITAHDRTCLDAHTSSDHTSAILTHYPIDTLDENSREWVTQWLSTATAELYLAGHRHFTRSRRIGGCTEIITRGLDPDKAFGGPPGISLFERRPDGMWAEEVVLWPHERDLSPAETPFSPVGWSIHGDPGETIRETYDAGISVVELRPNEPGYNLASAIAELRRLREDREIYLSWHLPNIGWDASSYRLKGEDALVKQIGDGQVCGVDAFTMHVPWVGASLLYDGNPLWEAFRESHAELFGDAIEDGVRLSIENVHNSPGTPLDRESRKFGTTIDECKAWMDAVSSTFGPEARVGAHLDVGHARNNGEFGNFQPLGDWYARLGRRITGYHIHQVRPHKVTGKLTNHREIKSLYDQTISYAGFLHAWSNHTINRAPLFVEVRDAEERRRTARMLKEVFG